MSGSPSFAADAGKSGVSSPEERAVPVRARSGPPVGGTARTVSVRVASAKRSRTSYDRIGVPRSTVTSTGTSTVVPRGTVSSVPGTRTRTPSGASTVSLPRASAGRSEPSPAVSRRTRPGSASTRSRASSREAAGESPNHGTR